MCLTYYFLQGKRVLFILNHNFNNFYSNFTEIKSHVTPFVAFEVEKSLMPTNIFRKIAVSAYLFNLDSFHVENQLCQFNIREKFKKRMSHKNH